MSSSYCSQFHQSSIHMSTTGVLAMVMLVAVALSSTQSVTVYTTQREPTVRGVFPSSTTSRGGTGSLTTPSPASPATVTTTRLVVTTTRVLILSLTAMRWEEEACATTAKTTQVRSLPHREFHCWCQMGKHNSFILCLEVRWIACRCH